jgi:hypothetical protein
LSWCVVRDHQPRRSPAYLSGATRVGNFSEQLWGDSPERRHMLTLAPGCSPWRLRPAVAALRLPSRTVAAGPTCGAQVAADLHGDEIGAFRDDGRPDQGVLWSSFALADWLAQTTAAQRRTDGLYWIVRHPLMLCDIFWPLGWPLIFRSLIGVALTLVSAGDLSFDADRGGISRSRIRKRLPRLPATRVPRISPPARYRPQTASLTQNCAPLGDGNRQSSRLHSR